MNIDQLKMRNEMYDYGLTEEDFKLLKEKIKYPHLGETYYIKKRKFVFGLGSQYYHSEVNHVCIRKAEEVKYIPLTLIGGKKLRFDINSEEAKHLRFIIEDVISDGYSDKMAFAKKEELTSIEIMKKLIKDEIMRKGNQMDDLKDISKDNIESLFWLFDVEMPAGFKKSVSKKEGLKRIVKVFEHDNCRLSIASDTGDYSFSARVFSLKNPEYNYIDEGRYFYGRRYLWDDLDIKKVRTSVLERLGYSGDFSLVTKEVYDRTERKYRLKIQKEKKDEELQEKIKIEFGKKLDNLENEPLEINGVILKQDVIICQDQKIEGKISYNHKDIDNSMKSFISDSVDEDNMDRVDFNTLFEEYCDRLEGCEFEGTLGSIKVKVDRKETEVEKRYNTIIQTRWLVNDVRINKDDVVDVLKRAICFDNEEEYEKLLVKVSKCNLKFHDIISNGLRIKFQDRLEGMNEDKILKFHIKRIKNRNYLVFERKDYPIRDTNKLINYSVLNENRRETPEVEGVSNMFIDMFDLKPNKVGKLFREGLKEYEEAVKKSEQFLKETLELFKVSEMEKNDEEGYLIKGSSGRQYFLTKDLKIYQYPSMKYICVVDKNLNKGFLNDRIVSRIYAIANDSLVSREIYTFPQDTKKGEVV